MGSFRKFIFAWRGISIFFIFSLLASQNVEAKFCDSVLRIVGLGRSGTPIPMNEIQATRALYKQMSRSLELNLNFKERLALKGYYKSVKSNADYSLPRRILGRVRSDGADLLWSIGPFFVRGLPSLLGLSIAKRGTSGLAEKTAAFNPEVLSKKLSIPNTPALAQSASRLQDASKTYTKKSLKKIWQRWTTPLIISSLLSIYGLHPLMIPYSLKQYGTLYSQSSYFSDLQNKAQVSFEKKNVVIIVDKALMKTSGYDRLVTDDDPTGISVGNTNFKKIKSQAGTYKAIPVENIAQWVDALKQAKNADVRIIAFHGLMGTLLLGDEDVNQHLRELDEVEAKEGSVTILAGCLSGDTSDEKDIKYEPWAKLATQLYGNKPGRVIASAREVTANPSPEGFVSELIPHWEKVKEAPLLILRSGLGLETLEFTQAFMEPAPPQVTRKAGFRVLDTSTGEAPFIAH